MIASDNEEGVSNYSPVADPEMAVVEGTNASGQFSTTLGFTIQSSFNPTGTNGGDVPVSEAGSFTVTGDIYAPAIAQVSLNGSVLPQGAVQVYAHVGDSSVQQFMVANTASGALTDVLNLALGSNASIFNVSTLPQGIASGSSGNFTETLNTSQAGSYSQSLVQFNSHDSELSDVAAASNLGTGTSANLSLSAIITNYADATVQDGGGVAILSGTGSNYVLDFGNIAQGSGPQSAFLTIANTYRYLEDGLSGTISASGSSAFTNSGLTAFSDVAGGYDDPNTPEITLATSNLGAFSQTLTFDPTDDDEETGTTSALAPITITVTGSVVSTASFGGTTNKTYRLTGGTTNSTGVSGDTNIADFTSGNTTPTALWNITEATAGTIVVNGAGAEYSGTATLKNFQQLDLNGTTYNLADTTISGEALTVGGGTSTVAIDGPGSDTLALDDTGTTYWHAGSGNTTALADAGTTELYMTGAESQYAITWAASSDTLTLVDSVSGRNNTKILTLAGGGGDIVFGDGSVLGFGQAASGDGTVYLGSNTQTVSAASAQVIHAGTGADTIDETSGGTVYGQGTATNVSLAGTDNVPDGNWAVSENAGGQVLVGGSAAGYSGTATLSNVGKVTLDGTTYNLVATPVAGGTTMVGVGNALVVDGAGNDAITFDGGGTSYWHAGGGNDTATLDNGLTEIYLAGSENQYTVSYDGTGIVTVVDSVAGRNGTKTIVMDGGQGELVFSDGSRIGLDQAYTADATVYAGAENSTLYAVVNETIDTGYGADTIDAALGDTIMGGTGLTTVELPSASGTPDQTWNFTQNASGQVLFTDPSGGIATAITLSNVARIGANTGSYQTNYGLTAIPAGGISTTVTNGGVVVDSNSNDTIHFDSTSDTYWYASGGNDTVLLDAGQTEIYLAGSASQYTFSYDGVNTVTVTDTISGRSGVKTIHIFAGDAELIFASGPSVALGNSIYQQDAIGYGGFQAASFYADPGTDSYVGSSDSTGNTVVFTQGGPAPNQAWQVSENAQGVVTVNGTAGGFAGTATLTNIQTVDIGNADCTLYALPIAGGSTLTLAPNSQGAPDALVTEYLGNNNLTLEYQDAYWHVNGANDTATIESGTTYLYMLGTEAQYTYSSGATLSVIDSVASRNGTLKATLAGGQGQVVFADGKMVWLGNETFVVSSGTSSYTGAGSTGNIANFVAADATPDQNWTIQEVTAGEITVTGDTASGFTGTTTLTDMQQIAMGSAIYDLLTTPVAGGTTTVTTPTDGSSGTVIADGAGNDTLKFDSADTTYWHVGNGNNAATLMTGNTEIELNGASSQFTESYNGTGILTVKNTSTNATETVTMAGGTGELVFTSGSSIGLGGGGSGTDTVQYGGDIAGETLTGTSGADTIYTGVGSTINGNGGVDNYWFGSGDKSVHINNGVSGSNSAAGQVDILGSLTNENLWFLKSGKNLVMDIIGSKDQVTINNYYTSGDTFAQVSQFDAGSLKLDTQLANLVQAMATYSANNSGFNPQTATSMPTNTALQNEIAAAWHS